MTPQEIDEARKFFHELWTDAANKRFRVRGRKYDREMKRKFCLIDLLMHRGARSS